MKVGTDGVLLGAWADVENRKRILDIGTGSGLIALMIAQRNSVASIEAIEIDPGAARQALNNTSQSPWRNRIDVIHISLQDFARSSKTTFDTCVCNPPFFDSSFPSANNTKRMARHTTKLSRESLFDSVVKLLEFQGSFSLILPFDQLQNTLDIATEFGLHLQRQTFVRPQPDQAYKRVLLEFGFAEIEPKTDEFAIERIRHQFTPEYERLTSQFHLRFADQESKTPTNRGDAAIADSKRN